MSLFFIVEIRNENKWLNQNDDSIKILRAYANKIVID